MTALLALAPAALGFVGLVVGGTSRLRRVVLRGVSVAGIAGALVMLAGASGLDPWRTVEPRAEEVAIVAAGALVAWVIAAARPDREVVALVGVAISGLFLFATGGWLAPALAFWICSSLALAAANRDPNWWIALALSDVALVAATVPEAIADAAWMFPEGPGGWEHWAIAGAVIVRSGAVLHLGAWRLLGSAAAPLPVLAMASAMVIATRLGGPQEPWLAAALLGVALALALWMLLRSPTIVAVGTWVSAVFAALVLAHSAVAVEIGWAAVLAMGVVLLWPFARGRSAVSRAAALALVPPSPAFAAIAAVAATAFARSTGADRIEQLAWTGVAALLPLVLASALVLAARSARTPRSDDFEPAPVIATWILVAATFAVGVVVRYLPGASITEFADTPLLAFAAVVGGVGALRARSVAPPATEPAPPVGVATLRRAWRAVLAAASAAAVGVAIAGVAWVLVEGLRVGFL